MTNFGTPSAPDSGSEPRKIYEIRLTNAQVTGTVTVGLQTFAETVTISATSLDLFFFPQNTDGIKSANQANCQFHNHMILAQRPLRSDFRICDVKGNGLIMGRLSEPSQ